MSGYTKGPWLNTGLFIEDEQGNAVAIALPSVPNSEREANANLIAAAPELLEALKDLEWNYGGWCPQCCANRGKPHQTNCILGNAIAKAEGK